MTYSFTLDQSIDLHVKGRIAQEAAYRQMKTAKVILERLEEKPGLILADEVGMGKTFVALAVAASVSLQDRQRRPVVVMVPPALKEKWPKDFRLFRDHCVSHEVSKRLTFASAERAVDFLKLLDDAPSKRASIIFLTHGAMSPQRKLQDGWVKLAVIQRALYRRRNTEDLRKSLHRFMGDLLRMKYVTNHNPEIWEVLLSKTSPRRWLKVLREYGLEPPDGDDPVPESVLIALEHMDFRNLFQTLKQEMPQKHTKHFDLHIARARRAVEDQITDLWDQCIRSLDLRMPLLVLDEAHHLKNPYTQLASLFQVEDAEQDVEEISRGPLASTFERMLFLTATPFQLGHYELCSVLERFTGISWNHVNAPEVGLKGFKHDLENIRSSLDAAQEAAIRLDNTWGLLQQEDLVIDGRECSSVEDWWHETRNSNDGALSPRGQQVIDRYSQAQQHMQVAERALQPYVIRHILPRSLPEPNENVLRRLRFPGKTILDDEIVDEAPGLLIHGHSLLPFLLAARVTVLNPNARPVFAEGLASSYEAFLHTRQQREQRAREASSALTDGDDDWVDITEQGSIETWYLNRLQDSIPSDSAGAIEAHPKISPVVQQAIRLWKEGEKVLIFCHYIATGRVMRQRVSEAMDKEICMLAAQKLGCRENQANEELEKIGNRFFDTDSPIRRSCDKAVLSILEDYSFLSEETDKILDIVRRFVRTPSFLVRYYPLENSVLSEDLMFQALNNKDASGMSLEDLLRDFFSFLVERCSEAERQEYIAALDQTQTGTHYGADVRSSFTEDELENDRGGHLLPNVRLANGSTRMETRFRLMATFNTPFYPEILIASMIMAEGVDLHVNCRHVIHHDLCWNPSTLEQRTGRIDRIGSKAERCGKSIMIYLPYIAQTQDEKMYRVVMDRERWFKVVMGERYKVDVATTDKLAQRLPFPEDAANELAFDLRVWKDQEITSTPDSFWSTS